MAGAIFGPNHSQNRPAQVIRQILGRTAVKAYHLLLQPAVAGILILDVIRPFDHPDTSRQVYDKDEPTRLSRTRNLLGSIPTAHKLQTIR